MTDPHVPVRSFGMNHVLVIACWVYATSQLYFHPEQKLSWMASILMGLGFTFLLRTGGVRDAFRSWAGRTGVVIVAAAWVLIGLDHIYHR